MSFIETLNNNLRYDILGNYKMCRQLGRAAGYGYLARKSWALAKAMVMNKKISLNNQWFYDTWG